MIDASTRRMLRYEAIIAWEDAKRLHRVAVDLRPEFRAVATASPTGSRVDHKAMDVTSIRRHGSVHEITLLVDQAIRRSDPFAEEAAANGCGAGLVGSVNLPTLIRLQEMVGGRLGYVVGAHDVGTALGLAIATQPDIAIIDARLDLGNGADLAGTLPMYAPCTKVLLLTDDQDSIDRVSTVGIDALPRRCPESDLLHWIAAAVFTQGHPGSVVTGA